MKGGGGEMKKFRNTRVTRVVRNFWEGKGLVGEDADGDAVLCGNVGYLHGVTEVFGADAAGVDAFLFESGLNCVNALLGEFEVEGRITGCFVGITLNYNVAVEVADSVGNLVDLSGLALADN